MNKSIFLCAAAALALASCSNDETVEMAKGDGINFRTVIGLNTRATELTQASFEQNNKLYVTTFKMDGTKLFDETLYTKGADGFWNGNQYWGTEQSLFFYLYYPELSKWKANAELTDKDNSSITGFTVADEIKDQQDFVIGSLPANKDVSLTVEMGHVLSQIEVQALNTNTAYKYKVRGVRFQNANDTGDLALMLANWSNQKGAKNYEVTYDNAIDLNGTAQTIMGTAGNAMLIPQNVTKWNGTDKSNDTTTPVTGSYISVLVSITTDAGAPVYPGNTSVGNPTYGWVSVPVDFAWEKGKKYIYKLDFSKGAGKVDPVNPNPDGKDDVKPGNPDPDKADPVLGDMIKFDVTVIDWTETATGDASGNTNM